MVVGASGAQQPKRLRCCLIAPRLLPCAMCPPHFLGVYCFMLQPLYQGSWFWRTDTCPGVLVQRASWSRGVWCPGLARARRVLI